MLRPRTRFAALVFSCSALALCACHVSVTEEAAPADGALLWSRTYGGPADDSASSLVLTGDAHARFIGKGALDGSTDPGEVRALVLDVDGDGTLTEHERLGSSSLSPVGLSMEAAGLDGQRILAGGFESATSLSGCALKSPFGFSGEFVAALDDAGACLWATSFAADVVFTSLHVSPTGEILVAGEGAPGGSLGASVKLPVPSEDLGGGSPFFARFSATGTPLAAVGVVSYALPLALYDRDGGILVAAQPSSGSASLARLDEHGSVSWSQQIPATLSNAGLVLAGSNVVVATSDPTRLTLRALRASDGSSAWKVEVAGADLDARVLGASADGSVVLAGHLAGGKSLSIGTTTLTGRGRNSLFWVLLDGAGVPLRSKLVPVDGLVYPSGVAMNADGDVWVLGTFTGSIDFGDGRHVAHAPPPPGPAVWEKDTGYDVFLARYR